MTMAKQTGDPTPVNEALLHTTTPKPQAKDAKHKPLFQATRLADEAPSGTFRIPRV